MKFTRNHLLKIIKIITAITVETILIAGNAYAGEEKTAEAVKNTKEALFEQAAKDEFNLYETIETVMKNSLQIVQASEENNAAKAGVKQAESAYFPQINVSAGYNYVNPVPTITLGKTAFSMGTDNNFDAHLGLQMKVFDFGKTAALVEGSRAKEEISSYNTNLTRQNLAFQSIRLFYSIIFLQKSLEVQDAELTDLEQNLQLMKNRVKAGSATDYDALNAEVRIAISKSHRIDLVNSLAIQKIQMNRFLGRDESAPLDLKGELYYKKVLFDENKIIKNGSEKRFEISIALKSKVIAEELLKEAERARLPDFYINGSAGFRNGYPLDYTVMTPNFNVGAKIEVPIFSGFRVTGKIEERTAQLKAASANFEDTRKSIKADILQAVKDIQAGEEKLAASDIQVSQAKDAVKRSLALYNAGAITSRDMLDARTSLLQVELMRLQSLYYYIIADYNLRRASGIELWNDK